MTDWQQRVATFMRRHRWQHDPVHHALDLVSEVGEVAKEVLLASDYGQQELQFGPAVADELGDALYSLLALAESCDVDAGQALEVALRKYERRFDQRGGAETP